MPLAPGFKLGPYEVVARLGAGGMGEVYRAKDSRLDRTVAIKVLPSHLSSNPDLRQRFEREARAVSSLNHPHICILHDVGHQDGIDFLVMEYIDGETLANRISKGALPLEQTLRYGMQIAEALDKAHRNGITHRDLKPGNIMLTKSGVKLLDFGLAKLHSAIPVSPQSPVSALATEQRNPLTNEGTILGTVQYMSPEQLEGREADARSDLWAFGCVLYEMATGQRAFEGKSQASIIAAIMHSHPTPMTSIQPLTPPAFDHVVTTCLAKDPDERWQSASDVTRELLWISSGSQSLTVPAVSITRSNKREVFAWALLILLAVFAAAVWMRKQTANVSSAESSRFAIPLPAGTEFGPYDSQSLSPNGRNMAFTASGPDGSLLWIRSLDSLEPRSLPGTEDAHFPFWSPDGRSVGFFAQGRLKKIDISGGAAEIITEAQNGRGGSWNSNGQIIFTPNFWSPIFVVSENGGPSRPVTNLRSPVPSTTHRWASFLPDQKHFLYTALILESGHRGQFCIGSLQDEKSSCFANGFSTLTYVDPGYVLFIRDSALVAQQFDLTSLKLKGTPIEIVSGVGRFASFGPAGYSAFCVSKGNLAYSKAQVPPVHLRKYDSKGTEITMYGAAGLFTEPFFSADGQKIAVTRQDSTGFNDIWLLDPLRGALTRLTFHSAMVWSPILSPDSSQLVYTFVRSGLGIGDLFLATTTAAGTPRLIWESGLMKLSDDWSPDGSTLLVDVSAQETRTDIWALPMKGGKPYPLIQTPFDESAICFSPDGRFVAYNSDESGRSEIYIQTFPLTGQKWQISTQGGTQAQWRKDGKELFYLSASLDLMAVDIRTAPRFETGIPHALFRPSIPHILANIEGRNQYAVDSNGHFLVVSGDAPAEPRQITVVLNWQSLLTSSQ